MAQGALRLRRRSFETGATLTLAAVSFVLTGYTGWVTEPSRFSSTPNRKHTMTLTGIADSSSELVCAYQQTNQGPSLAAPLGCDYPRKQAFVDSAGVTWWSFEFNVKLLESDEFWFGQDNPSAAIFEFARVLVTRPVQNGALYTATLDLAEGPSDIRFTGYRSMISENAARVPLTIFKVGMPSELECTKPGNVPDSRRRGRGTALLSYAGCPYTCSLQRGCDQGYGDLQDNFYQSQTRVDSSGNSTALTRFEHDGEGADWTYQPESGTCWGGRFSGAACEDDDACGQEGACVKLYTVLRRNADTGDSLKLRRGAQRRNARVEAWARMSYATPNAQNQEIGLVQRYLDGDNYFAFVVREYGGDKARIHQKRAGKYGVLAAANAAMRLNSWSRLGFEVTDNGSYVEASFIPNGRCRMGGYIDEDTVVTANGVPCAFAPHGKYGVFSAHAETAQFWDLDAFMR